MTIEFYSAPAQEFAALFSSLNEEVFFEKLHTYPVANFSLHLLIPDDLDRLCQVLAHHHLAVAPTFREMLVEQLWYDGLSESLTIVAESFAKELASLSDTALEQVVSMWSEPFNYQEPLWKTPAYQALMQLRNVAEDVVTHSTSLILHLLG